MCVSMAVHNTTTVFIFADYIMTQHITTGTYDRSILHYVGHGIILVNNLQLPHGMRDATLLVFIIAPAFKDAIGKQRNGMSISTSNLHHT